jgi:alpha-ribazole phosphatase
MPYIYLIRHGEIHTQRKGIFVGQLDLSLTSTGREQIRNLRSYFTNIQIQKIISSPLSRCIQSSNILLTQIHCTMEVERDLAEISLGSWEGLRVDQVHAKYPGQYEKRGNDIVNYKPNGGESFKDLKQRVWSSFLKVTKNLSGNIIIVCHAGVNRIIISSILGMPLNKIFCIQQHYGCINKIHLKNNIYTIVHTNHTL